MKMHDMTIFRSFMILCCIKDGMCNNEAIFDVEGPGDDKESFFWGRVMDS